MAVLEILDPPSWVPDPAELRAGLAPPTAVRVFGFPRGERDVVGVWRIFDVWSAQVAGSAAVQLNWSQGEGTLPGHSGGAVLDIDTGTVAGILIEGTEAGRFDRYTPTHIAQDLWSELPRPAGDRPGGT